jgi:hypothetical protein
MLVDSSGAAASAPSVLSDDDNPLRMLRSGMAVRPRVRGNKQRHLQEQRQAVSGAASEWPPHSSRSLPRPRTNSHPQPPAPPLGPVPAGRRRNEAPMVPPPPVPLDSRSASEDSLHDFGAHQNMVRKVKTQFSYIYAKLKRFLHLFFL